MSDGKRAFMMGNALVVGLVERVADELDQRTIAAPTRRRRSGPPPLASGPGRTAAPEPAADQPGRPQRHACQPRPRHRARNAAYARPFVRPASAAIGSTGGRRPADPTSPTQAARSRSSSTAATGITARAATRTCRSRTRISGRASSSSTANGTHGSARTSSRRAGSVDRGWECDVRDRVARRQRVVGARSLGSILTRHSV